MKAAEYVEAVKEYKKLEEHFFGIFAAELIEEMKRYAALPCDGSDEGKIYSRGQAQQREAIKAWIQTRQSPNTSFRSEPNGK